MTSRSKNFSFKSPFQSVENVTNASTSAEFVLRGLSSGGNDADDEYDDDESVFAPVVIGVTSSIREVELDGVVGAVGMGHCNQSLILTYE